MCINGSAGKLMGGMLGSFYVKKISSFPVFQMTWSMGFGTWSYGFEPMLILHLFENAKTTKSKSKQFVAIYGFYPHFL
ncbi:hypothetical protein RJT34_20528 [Clitoria ternatea]|uniref:Uncharacterized protein n=1 Tax=Clitoria ternatea TaxID=43366 RepID=A0AAN9ISZ4_CLITE